MATTVAGILKLGLPPFATQPRATSAGRHKAEKQRLHQSMKSKSSINPLAPVDGNKRRSRAKPSSKEKKNITQQEENIIVLDDGTVEVMDTARESTVEPAQWIRSNGL